MGTNVAVHNSTHYPVPADDEILVITEAELRMKEMPLDRLRQEDEIQTRPMHSQTMKMVFQQAPLSPAWRDALSLPPSKVFLPPMRQTLPPLGAQVKVTFSDISGMQRKTDVASIDRNRQGDNFDRDASRVFQLSMKVTDGRTFVETDDVLNCQLDYDASPQSGSPLSFKRLPTSSAGTPIGIRIELLGQVVRVQIASNSSPNAVEDKAKLLWG
jgi:hypothetical protein